MPQVSPPDISESGASEPGEPVPRKRGRPPRTIDPDAVVDAVDRLFAAGRIDALTIERTAAELGVSRATLYRSDPSKAELLGLHFVRRNEELYRSARLATSARGATPRERLVGLIRVQIQAAVKMRDSFFVYFDGSQ